LRIEVSLPNGLEIAFYQIHGGGRLAGGEERLGPLKEKRLQFCELALAKKSIK
jgi:hypothetical protein